VSQAGGRRDDLGRDHYSYTHYADSRVAERFDALRFGGPVGGYLLECQERILADALAPLSGRTVIDVGTGTGRAAIALARAGASVTGVDASREMLDVARARATEAGVSVQFEEGDAHALQCADRSADAVVSLRVLMHTPDWRQCVAEFCRVARWRVVVDFPALGSAASLESASRRVLHALGRPVEAYRVMSEWSVRRTLARHGFRIVSVHRQFALPIALHKKVGSLRFTTTTERALASVGLRRLLGSPVTMVAER
jgi:ubiquinone/menaquinone biosynthesis C-methylase UbiE